MIASVVFCIGAIIQVVNTHSLGAFYAGRVISGLGTGAATVLVPMFSAEMAPKEFRGRLGSCFQLFFAIGVTISYWVTYAASSGLASNTQQWQVPIGLQLVPGALMGLGMFFTKESVRWYAKKGRNEEAFASLQWVRGGEDTPELRAEFQEILAGVQVEIQQSEGLTWKELLLPSNRLRMFIAITIQLAAQLTGNTSLAYYAPQIFATIGAGDKSLFITGFFGLVKIAGVVVFQLLLVDVVGRKKPFMGGSFAMGCLFLIIAIIVQQDPPSSTTQNWHYRLGWSWYCDGLPRSLRLQHVMGSTTLALHWRDLPEPDQRDWHCNWSSKSVVVQLHDVSDHAVCYRQHRVADVPDVCDFQLRDHLLHILRPPRDRSQVARGDGGRVWYCGQTAHQGRRRKCRQSSCQ